MDIILAIILVLALLAVVLSLLLKSKRKSIDPGTFPEKYHLLLTEHVPFYQQLPGIKQKEFEIRVQHFLSQVRITGVNTEVGEIDKILIAASAIIPIFNFQEWEYINLHEVLLYPDSFSSEFEQEGSHRNILGMVGSGAYNHVMLLSQNELRQAFSNTTGKTNTAIHEFVHLLDKTDGEIDGLPESLLEKKYVLPWLQLMQQEISLIRENQSDINPYGATNESEFFAVASEYFFERPDLLQEKHPALYELLMKIFRR